MKVVKAVCLRKNVLIMLNDDTTCVVDCKSNEVPNEYLDEEA